MLLYYQAVLLLSLLRVLDGFEFHQVSVTFRSYRMDLVVLFEAIKSAMHYVPTALEYVVVVPEADYELMKAYLQFNSSTNFHIYSEKKYLKNDRMQQKYSKMHADTYCKGDYILHVDSDMVFRKELKISDIAFNGKPILFFQHVSKLPSVYWPIGTSGALGRTVDFEFSRTALKVFPRQLYLESRDYLVKVQGKSLVEFLDGCEPLHDPKYAKRLFSDFNYLGAYAYYHRQRWFALNPLDEDLRQKYRDIYHLELPPHPDYSIMCQGNAQAAQFTDTEKELEIILRNTWLRGDTCDNLKSMGKLYGQHSHAHFNKYKLVCLDENDVSDELKKDIFRCSAYRPTLYLIVVPPEEKWSGRPYAWEILPFNKPYEEIPPPDSPPISASSIPANSWRETDPIPTTQYRGVSIPRNSGEKFTLLCFNNYDHTVKPTDGSKPPFSRKHFFCHIGSGDERKRHIINFPSSTVAAGDIVPFIL